MPADVKPVYSELKLQSIGWLLGRCLILCHKVVRTFGNDPAHKDLVNEAKELINRWKTEQGIHKL